MTPELSEEYLLACIIARRTTHFLPAPPPELQKRHIHIIRICYKLSLELDEVRVSDVAEKIDVTLPSITRNITTLEENGYLRKEESTKDKRVINIILTDKGVALYKEYVCDFHKRNSEVLKDIPEEDIRVTIKTFHEIYRLMEEEHTKSLKERK